MTAPGLRSAQVDRLVKSDLKIFLLAELSRAEVLHAIELPTSKVVVEDGRSPPFDKYRFSYAPGVAQRIVDDLFEATSATAVLPGHASIACCDLYTEAKRSQKAPPWQIDAALYAKGGGISGPVDRHITKSLKDSFGKLPAGTDSSLENGAGASSCSASFGANRTAPSTRTSSTRRNSRRWRPKPASRPTSTTSPRT